MSDTETCHWGFHDSDVFEDEVPNNQQRLCWIEAVSTVTLQGDREIRKNVGRKKRHIKKPRTLCIWVDSNAATSTKAGAQNNLAMNLTACVDGFRIVQTNGEFIPEFQLSFCFGSVSYLRWKRMKEFQELAKLISNKELQVLFPKSLAIWREIERSDRWFDRLSSLYLIGKCTMLSEFVQVLLLESPNPTLLLSFVTTETFSLPC